MGAENGAEDIRLANAGVVIIVVPRELAQLQRGRIDVAAHQAEGRRIARLEHVVVLRVAGGSAVDVVSGHCAH